MKIRNLLIGTALVFFGCSQGPNYETPTTSKTKTYLEKNEQILLKQHVTLAKKIETDWWKFLKSEELNTLIAQSIKNNYDLASAKETLEQAKEAVNAKNGALFPQLSASATAGRQKYGVALFGPSDFKIPPFSYYIAGLSASWTLDVFGAKKREVERQKALEKYQMYKVNVFYIALTGNTASAALDIASLKSEILTYKKIIQEDKNILALVEKSHQLGEAPQMDVLNARTRLNNDEMMLPSLKQSLSKSYHTLAILLGKSPSQWKLPNLDFDDFSLPKKIPLQLPSELVKNRPDILAAESSLHASSAAVGVAEANRYPSLTLSANMMMEALKPENIFNITNNAWAIAAQLSAPVFDGGTLKAEENAAKHAYKASLFQYRQTILVAFREVADTLTALAHDDEEIAVVKDSLVTAEESWNITRKSYEAGAVSLLQMHDSKRNVQKAKLDLIRTKQHRFLDYIRLFVVLGGSSMSTV